MARLRRSDCRGHGIRRRRCGRGFTYAWSDGTPVDAPDVLQRIRDLAVPPAWVDVWICPWSNGHIQATGTDAAGRRQYRYHDDWHERQGRAKFARVESFASQLPQLRSVVAADLAREDWGRQRILATVVRLLDVGAFRIGGEEYAEEHETYGVATLHRDHVTARDGILVFDYPAKGSLQRVVSVEDPAAFEVVHRLKHRRSPDPRLFACKDGRRWVDIRSGDVNAYVKSIIGDDYSAKDFRTWSATLLAATVLAAAEPPASPTGVRRTVSAAITEVATQLGNTPAVCRASYVDPRVIDRFESGETIQVPRTLADTAGLLTMARRQSLEQAVVDLLAGTPRATPRAA